MNHFFKLIILLVFATSCGGTKKESKTLTYKNIVILADLSSRIKNKPLKDNEEIFKLLQYFKNECVKPGEKIGDKSSISFSSFSDESIASIDLNSIENIGEKQQFINSTGKYEEKGLDYAINQFQSKVNNSYSTISNQGLDLISVIIDKIQNDQVTKKDIIKSNGKDTVFINFDNHVYIFTDGYLEYKNKEVNKQFYFGANEIDKIRKFCIQNNLGIKQALETESSLSLSPSNHIENSHINLHILETHERDKDDRLQTYKYPQGLRDNEILEAVWRKWANESGFKSFEWKKY